MTEHNAKDKTAVLEQEYNLEAKPEKVWRAISLPAYREHWLPEGDLLDGKAITTDPGKEISYRMRENNPPHLESLVTFQLSPAANGGTCLRITHRLTDARLNSAKPPAANNNHTLLMRAA